MVSELVWTLSHDGFGRFFFAASTCLSLQRDKIHEITAANYTSLQGSMYAFHPVLKSNNRIRKY